MSLFLQGVPREVDVAALKEESVDSVHHLHVWSLDGEHHVLTVHAVLRETANESSYREAKQAIRQIASDRGFDHVTVEVEFADEACAMR